MVGSELAQPTPDQSYPAPMKEGLLLATGEAGKPEAKRLFPALLPR